MYEIHRVYSTAGTVNQKTHFQNVISKIDIFEKTVDEESGYTYYKIPNFDVYLRDVGSSVYVCGAGKNYITGDSSGSCLDFGSSSSTYSQSNVKCYYVNSENVFSLYINTGWKYIEFICMRENSKQLVIIKSSTPNSSNYNILSYKAYDPFNVHSTYAYMFKTTESLPSQTNNPLRTLLLPLMYRTSEDDIPLVSSYLKISNLSLSEFTKIEINGKPYIHLFFGLLLIDE